MSLHATILEDLKTAMKAKDADRLSVLRMVQASLLNQLKEHAGTNELSDEVVTTILRKELKKRKEAEQAFIDGDRVELAAKEAAEADIIASYVPEQLSEEAIEAYAKEVIAEVGTENFGAVMGATMKKTAGQADGALVKQVVERLLS